MFCDLVQLDLGHPLAGRWYCPACDPKKERTLPVRARRNCSDFKPAPVHQQVIRSIAAFMNDCPRSEEELRRLAEQCAACEDYVDGCGRFRCGQRYGKWMELLAKGRCEKWT